MTRVQWRRTLSALKCYHTQVASGASRLLYSHLLVSATEKESPSYCPPFAGCSAHCSRRRKGSNQPVAMLPDDGSPAASSISDYASHASTTSPRVPVNCMQCKGDVESRPAHTYSPLQHSQAAWLIFELEFDAAYLKRAQSRLGCLGGGCPAVVVVALARFCWFLLMGIGQLAVV